MRIAHWSPAVIGAAAVAAALAAVPLAAAAASPDATVMPPHFAAPYLQIAPGDASEMAADMKASGDKYYTLAFLIPSGKGSCTAKWEDGNDAMNAFTSEVKALQNDGGNVIVSFGGASGGEPAEQCSSESSLEAEYANVVNTYGITRLDFDIECGNCFNSSENAINDRRDEALAALQKADPSVTVDFTLPGGKTYGLTPGELTFVKTAVNTYHVKIMLNIMTMYFGEPESQLVSDCEASTTSAAKQLEGVYGTSSPDYSQLGVTPFIGSTGAGDDDGYNEKFTQADADAFEPFAAKVGVQALSFWEVSAYDAKVGYVYSSEFNKITSGSTSGGS